MAVPSNYDAKEYRKSDTFFTFLTGGWGWLPFGMGCHTRPCKPFEKATLTLQRDFKKQIHHAKKQVQF
jgi:hypothetical protein